MTPGGLLQAVFFPFEVMDERHRDVLVAGDVKVVVEGGLCEDILLVIGRA